MHPYACIMSSYEVTVAKLSCKPASPSAISTSLAVHHRKGLSPARPLEVCQHACRLAARQGTLAPVAAPARLLIFGADHGVAMAHSVSAYPSSGAFITTQLGTQLGTEFAIAECNTSPPAAEARLHLAYVVHGSPASWTGLAGAAAVPAAVQAAHSFKPPGARRVGALLAWSAVRMRLRLRVR